MTKRVRHPTAAPSLRVLSQRRNFLKFRLAGIHANLSILIKDPLLDDVARFRIKQALNEITPVLDNWDPEFLRKWR